jgi:RimJ/RimL family protein N-acetyltransferase
VTDLVIRRLQPGEESVFDKYCEPVAVGPPAFGRTYRQRLESGEYRPEWTWVALRGDTVVARAAWWAGPTEADPVMLDWLDCADAQTGGALVRAAGLPVEYGLIVPPGWRDQPALRAAGQVRIDAATAAGLRPLVERYFYRWTPECGLPPRPGRLEYRPEPDDEAILAVLRRTNQGTLDAHARYEIQRGGIEAAARDDLTNLRWLPSPREWWQLAYTPAGDLVGLTVPARNLTNPVVGHIAVVPEQRGHGYAYDLLVECTHRLVETGCDRVIGATDVTNTPMAAAFAKAGYPVYQEHVYLI